MNPVTSNAGLRSIWPTDVMQLPIPRLPAIMALEPDRLNARLDAELSVQQKRVLLLLSYGHANKTIAWVLGLEEATAKAHVSSILKKLSLTNRTQAALLGLRVRLHAVDSSSVQAGAAKGGATVAIECARHSLS